MAKSERHQYITDSYKLIAKISAIKR